MTDREKAIVMAYTGVCMLTGDKFQVFHEYIEDIMGRPVWTHEIAWLEKEIKEKSKADFIALCADEGSSEKPNEWIPVSKRSPEKSGYYWCTFGGGIITGRDYYTTESDAKEIYDEPEEYIGWRSQNVVAWMPLPESYKAESEE